jgi:hypothetical protein
VVPYRAKVSDAMTAGAVLARLLELTRLAFQIDRKG